MEIIKNILHLEWVQSSSLENSKKDILIIKNKFYAFYKLKSGESIFKFDQVSDKFTLDLALDQQLYGPYTSEIKSYLKFR